MLAGINDVARRRMRNVLSALCSALILVMKNHQEFIDELEKGFETHQDSRPSSAGTFDSYLNVLSQNQKLVEFDLPFLV